MIVSRVEILAGIFFYANGGPAEKKRENAGFRRKITRLPVFLRNLAAVTGTSWKISCGYWTYFSVSTHSYVHFFLFQKFFRDAY